MTLAAPQTDLFCTTIGSWHYQRDHQESPPTKNQSGSDADAKAVQSPPMIGNCSTIWLFPKCTPVRSKSLRSTLFPRNQHRCTCPTLKPFRSTWNAREWITSFNFFSSNHCAIFFCRSCNHQMNQICGVVQFKHLCSGMGKSRIEWNAFGQIEFNIWPRMKMSETLLNHRVTDEWSLCKTEVDKFWSYLVVKLWFSWPCLWWGYFRVKSVQNYALV